MLPMGLSDFEKDNIIATSNLAVLTLDETLVTIRHFDGYWNGLVNYTATNYFNGGIWKFT